MVCGVLAFVIVPVPADASATPALTCLTNYGNYYDGFENDNGKSSPTFFEGASAYIVTRKPTICSAFSFSGAWSMIGGAGGPGCQYAQSGYMYGINPNTNGISGLWNFAQWNDCKHIGTYWSASQVATGQKIAYRSLWTASCGCVEMSISGGNFLATPFNPYASGEWQFPFQPQFFGEATTSDDAVPGTLSAKASFSALGAQLTSNDQLVSMPCTMTAYDNEPTRWSHQASSCIAFDIWTI